MMKIFVVKDAHNPARELQQSLINKHTLFKTLQHQQQT